jgi:hypothetical protein
MNKNNTMTTLNNLIKQRQGDYWQLEKTAEETESGCPKFVRANKEVTQLQKEAYRQALEDVLTGLFEEKPSETIRAYDEYGNGFVVGKTNSGHNIALKTVQAQIEGLLGNITDV